MIKNDDFLLQILWIRDYSSGLDLPFWPFVFLSNGILKFQIKNQILSSLAFSLFLIIILYHLISALDSKIALTRFVRLGISSTIFLTLTHGLFKYYSFPTYQFLSFFVALASSLLFLKARKQITNFYIISFACLTLFASLVRFPQSLFVGIAFVAALLGNSKQGGIQPRVAIFRYVLVALTILIVLDFTSGRQLENLYRFVIDSFAFSSMPIERPITNILYTSLITVFPLIQTILKGRQGVITFVAISMIIGYNLLYFRISSSFLENIAIAMSFLILAIRLNPSIGVLKIALLLNILMSSFLFGSYNAIRDFQSIQVGLLSFTLLIYYLAHDDAMVIVRNSKKINLLLGPMITVISLTLLLVQAHIVSKEMPLSSNSLSVSNGREDFLFIDLTGRQDGWLLARDNGWAVFPYVIPAIFPSSNVENQRVLAIANEVLEERVNAVLGLLENMDKVTKFQILVEGKQTGVSQDLIVSKYSLQLLTLLKLDTKLCKPGKKLNERFLPEQTLLLQACPHSHISIQR